MASSAGLPASPVAEEPNPMNDMRAKIMAIMRDTTLTEEQKAQKRQELMMGGSKWAAKPAEEDKEKEKGECIAEVVGTEAPAAWPARASRRRLAPAPL